MADNQRIDKDIEEKVTANKNQQKIPDFVLIFKSRYKTYDESLKEDEKVERDTLYSYLENLQEIGLNLELGKDIDDKHSQVYISAKDEILLQYAELLKMRLPLLEKEIKCEDEISILRKIINFMKKILPFTVEVKGLPPKPKYLTAEFTMDKKKLDFTGYFTKSEKSMIIKYILQLEHYEEGSPETPGLKKLMSDGIITDAYPLHNGEEKDLLIKKWANLKKWYKIQPIDHIKDYFGIKIALYFAWLGFYTDMLIPVSIFGIFCFFCGISTMFNDEMVNDICNPEINITMCPQCDMCDFWSINEACLHSKISHTFDNYLTIAFAIVMSCWSSLYVNLWKNYSAELVHRWGLSTLSAESIYPRMEYIKRVNKLDKKHDLRKKIKCQVTERLEPKVPFILKLPNIALSTTVALFGVSILIAVLLALLVFRISFIVSEEIYREVNTDGRSVMIPVSAAIIDLISILILNVLYEKIAVYLTNRELLRTQSEYDDSLTLKIYTFQFINYYSGFFYIAFIKGRFIGTPNEYIRLIWINHRQEECPPGGCFVELFIQLAIVMIGDQLIGQIIEYGTPWFTKKFKERKSKEKKVKNNDIEMAPVGNLEIKEGQNLLETENKLYDSESTIPNRISSRCSIDFKSNLYKNNDHVLTEWDERGLFDEYLEMVIQYGFVTLFVTAFPLAPLCALINNVFELRGDAKKFLLFYRRPVSETVTNIGVWLKIIDMIGKLAIVTNGFILAFASNIVPRLFYMIQVTKKHSYDGFLNFTLSVFDINDFDSLAKQHMTGTQFVNMTECRYTDYRNPPDDEYPYMRSGTYWHILACRFVFLLLYHYIVIVLNFIVKRLISDKQKELQTQVLKEQWTICKFIAKNQAEGRLGKKRQSNGHLKKVNSIESLLNGGKYQENVYVHEEINVTLRENYTITKHQITNTTIV